MSRIVPRTRRTWSKWLAGCGLALTTGCGIPATSTAVRRGNGPVGVVTSTALVADLVRNVGGDAVNVVSLMGEGVDPHLYKGSPRDVRALADSELIIANGLHLEGKLISVFERLARHKPTHLLGETLSEKRHHEGRQDPWIRDEGAPDPHCWFDVAIWREFATLMTEILSAFDPPNATKFRGNGERHIAELDTLDGEIRASITRLPKERRLLITSHDAFRYFGRAYGIQVEGIQGLSTESESGVRRTNELVDLVVARGVPAIFVESSVADDNVMALVEGATARGHALRIGGSLFSDAPGAFGTPEGTYLGMMRHNVRTFVDSMSGSHVPNPHTGNDSIANPKRRA
ncbi:manganese transporter [bacterium]|nr:manganese transporter [bacterium]